MAIDHSVFFNAHAINRIVKIGTRSIFRLIVVRKLKEARIIIYDEKSKTVFLFAKLQPSINFRLYRYSKYFHYERRFFTLYIDSQWITIRLANNEIMNKLISILYKNSFRQTNEAELLPVK